MSSSFQQRKISHMQMQRELLRIPDNLGITMDRNKNDARYYLTFTLKNPSPDGFFKGDGDTLEEATEKLYKAVQEQKNAKTTEDN